MDKLQMMRFFVGVAKTGGFSTVAVSANTSTACISRSITRLEQHLSTRLLNRTTRKLSLTSAGAKYLHHCEQILSEIYDAEREAAEAKVRPAGVIKVHAASGVGPQNIIGAITDYQLIFPDVLFDLTITDKQPDLVGEGYDVSIVIAHALTDSSFVSQHLGTSHGIICAAPGYLTKYGTPMNLPELSQHNCVGLAEFQHQPQTWDLQGPDGQVSFQPMKSSITATGIDILRLAVENGMGVGMQPLTCAKHGILEHKLEHILKGYRSADLHIFAIYPSRRFLDAKIKTWVEFLKNVFENPLISRLPTGPKSFIRRP